MSTHSEFGPSSLEKRELCPGSFRMELGLAEPRGGGAENPNSARGRELHALMEAAVQAELFGIDVGKTRAKIDALNDVDYDQINFCVETVKAAWDKYQAQFPNQQIQVLVECRLNLAALNPAVDHGTLDLAFILPNRTAHILDFKFGSNPVTAAETNIQGGVYLWGLANEYGVRSGTISFIQPALNRISECIHDEAAILNFARRANAIVATAQKPDAPLVPGEKQCRYCKAAGGCPARADYALAPVTPALPSVQRLTPAQIAMIIERAKDIRNFLDAVEGRAREMLEDGAELPGVVLVPGRGSREWADPAKIETELAHIAGEFGKDTKDIVNIETASPAQIEARWGRRKELRERIEKLIVRKQGAMRPVKAPLLAAPVETKQLDAPK